MSPALADRIFTPEPPGRLQDAKFLLILPKVALALLILKLQALELLFFNKLLLSQSPSSEVCTIKFFSLKTTFIQFWFLFF